MTDDIHDLLQRQRATPRRPLSNNFTNDILKHIVDAPRRQPFAGWVHPPISKIRMRLLHLPKVALVALTIAAAGTGTAAALGAYNWLAPKIDILGITARNDDNKREFAVDVTDCGVMVGGETANNGVQRYEVAKDAHLTDEQVITVLKTSCEYQQLLQLSNTRFNNDPGYPNPSTIKPGDVVSAVSAGAGGDNVLNDPWISTITAIGDGHITLASKIYQEFDGPTVLNPDKQTEQQVASFYKYYPKGKVLTRTFTLSPTVDVIENGQNKPSDSLKIGDRIFFMSKVTRVIQADKSWGNPASIEVVHAIKTDIDPDYVQPMSVGNPAIINAVARLEGCQGNGDFLCITGKSMSQHLEPVYSSTVMQESLFGDHRFDGNAKYFRTDIDQQNMKSEYYHSIEGRITKLDGTKLTIAGRGKQQAFTVTLPYDAVKAFNSATKIHVGVDDYIQVSYVQKTGEDRTAIKPGDSISLSLLERQLPDGSFAKY